MAQEEPSTTHEVTASSLLSDYERTRAINIERNNARLRELGLISLREERRSNDLAWKRSLLSPSKEEAKEGDDKNDQKEGVVKKKRKQTPLKPPTEPTRKSRRVQGQDPEGMPAVLESRQAEDDGTLEEIRQQQVEECRQARQLAALRYSQLSDAEKKAAKENPTATYEHCLKRVRTMTEKALYNRVKAIERATGKHCVIKMAIFKSCLQDEGMWELASAASEALERLKSLSPSE